MKPNKVTVVQNPDDVVEPVVLATAIRGISLVERPNHEARK